MGRSYQLVCAMSVDEQLADLTRGAIDVIDRAELRTKLARGAPLVVKLGADPTAPDLHLGHSVVLDALRRYQDHGHRVQFLIGDFTGAIGDPTGRNTMRPQLTAAQIQAAADTYARQVAKILRPDAMEIVFNSAWYGAMSVADFIRITQHATVAQILARDDFARRFAARTPIALHELLYPLVQGYDSVAMRADVELGGTDQLFNVLVGRELQARYGQEPQIVMTLPLLVGTDGIEKMSKSKGNAIGIAESPTVQVTKTMAITDETAAKWYAGLYQEAPVGAPRAAKLELARRIVTRYHGADAAGAALDEYERKAKGGLPDTLPEVTCAPGTLVDVLVAAGLVKKRGDAWRDIERDGVSLDGARAKDPNAQLGPGTYVLRVGKNRFARVTVVA